MTSNNELMVVVVAHPQFLTEDELMRLKNDLKDYFVKGAGKVCNISSLYFQQFTEKQVQMLHSHYQQNFQLKYIFSVASTRVDYLMMKLFLPKVLFLCWAYSLPAFFYVSSLTWTPHLVLYFPSSCLFSFQRISVLLSMCNTLLQFENNTEKLLSPETSCPDRDLRSSSHSACQCQCKVVNSILKKYTAPSSSLEDGDSIFLGNICICLQVHIVLLSRRPTSIF